MGMDWLKTLKTWIGYEGATSLAAKLTAARAAYLDKLAMTPTTGSHNVQVADGTTEVTVFTIARTDAWRFSVYLRMAALVAAGEGGTITVRYYMKANASDYDIIGKSTFVVGTDTVIPSCEVQQGYHGIKVTIQCSADVTDTRAVPYAYVING